MPIWRIKVTISHLSVFFSSYFLVCPELVVYQSDDNGNHNETEDEEEDDHDDDDSDDAVDRDAGKHHPKSQNSVASSRGTSSQETRLTVLPSSPSHQQRKGNRRAKRIQESLVNKLPSELDSAEAKADFILQLVNEKVNRHRK
jgi:hypothetical protein